MSPAPVEQPLGPAVRPASYTGPVIDADVHAEVPSLDTLLAYMSPMWTEWVRERAWSGPLGGAVVYPPNAPTTCRPEWRPADGTVPASRPELLAADVLDPWGTERAIVNCCYAVDSVRHPDLTVALASAVNDWLIDRWLDRDPRLRASLVVPPRDPEAMIREIDRVGGHPGFVQVLMPVRGDRLYGNRAWHPLYRAMARHDLVMGLHWGGTPDGAPSPTGYPSWYVEEYAAEWQSYLAQVTSMIAEGVFSAVPELRVSLLESGFTWMPFWGWRMNKEWKGLRREVPWIHRPPMDIMRDHLRITVAPTHVESRADLERVLGWIDCEETLMFATDYPHLHEQDVPTLLEAMPESMRAKVMAGNAREWYRL